MDHLKQIASYGRNGDTELMHVSKDEVRTLQGLGALTVNPVTGLPEAFQLSDLMPIVGLAASFFGGPLAGAAVSGLGTALKTHSLGQGLMSGLASWGMGSLLSGAGGSATDAATKGATDTAGSAVGDAATAAPGASVMSGSGPLGANSVMSGAAPTASGGLGASQTASSMPGGFQGMPTNGSVPGAAASPYAGMQNGQWSASNLQGNLGSTDFWAANKPAMYATGAGLYGGSAMQEQQQRQQQADALNAANAQHQKQLHDQYLQAVGYANQMNPQNSFYQPNGPYTMATGGMIGDSGLYGLHAHQPLIADKMHSAYGAQRFDGGGQTSEYQNAQQFGNEQLQARYMAARGMAEGGYTPGDNGMYAPHGSDALHDGNGIEGLLKGPGDGMSDHIPATIEGHTPARLANDEFVVPADVVSHLGNGSTSAGAKHLYDMLDRVRKARVGHTKQGKQIDAHEHLPV